MKRSLSNTWTKTLLGTVAVALMTVGMTVQAWSKHEGEDCNQRAEHRMERMSKALELSDEQARTVEAIFEESSVATQANEAELSALRQSLRDQRENFDETSARDIADKIGAATSEMAFAKASTQAQIYAVLNDEQREKMDTLMEKKERRHSRMRKYAKMRG